MTQTTTTQVSAAVSTYYDRLLLQRATPYLIHTRFAQVRPLPKKEGNTIKFRRYGSLSTATTPLTEGITPSGSQLSTTDLTAVVSQYGDFVEISDVVDLTVEDAVITETVEILGQQMGESLDEIVRDVLSSTASATNASGGDNSQTPTEITRSDIQSVVKTMMGNNAQMISDVIKGSGNFGTVPIAPAYFCLSDSDMTKDISNISTFVSTQEYGNQGSILEAEWGSVDRVRFLVSSVGKATSESPVQYHNFIVGKNAYGMSEVAGGSAKTIIKAFGSGGTADPLEQRASVGWKTLFIARILNDSFIHNLETTLDT
ncbi:MAG: N4-gp56 family major capsid protein [Candidatus Thorarchaeota archaeon]